MGRLGLDALFAAPLGNHLVFKGGTSLSKAYDVIRRFSEDVRALATTVARHKNAFFRERDGGGAYVDHAVSVSGGLQLVPEGDRLSLLADDYQRMGADGLLFSTPPPFRSLIALCLDIQNRAHAAAR